MYTCIKLFSFRQLRIDFKKINNHKQNSDLTRSHRRVGRWHFKFRPCNQRLSWHIHHHATKAREVHLDSLYAGLDYEILSRELGSISIIHPHLSLWLGGCGIEKTLKRWQWSCPENQVACERTSQHTIQRLGISQRCRWCRKSMHNNKKM